MAELVVSIQDERGATQFCAEFTTLKAVRKFVEWRIEEFLDRGAKYVVVAARGEPQETRYRAAGIADCVLVQTDWRYALAREVVAA